MAIDAKVRDETLLYCINRDAAKTSDHRQEKLMNMNIWQVKKCYILIKETKFT